ncbi:PREDICTED: hyaluronidase-1-like isoform X3 [Branchiostoma belcheri]|uniref:Hyaluronidase n=1 Tax=Branchiostoma belcheri TaxID=7741 RepID=A0A6P4ZNB0_BRABE|nr:PREDICTED: hyaluronidase-1-like isoform X3 [Branchiostoma belcheri]
MKSKFRRLSDRWPDQYLRTYCSRCYCWILLLLLDDVYHMSPSSKTTSLVLLLLGLVYVTHGGPALPDRPFNIVWNVPSRKCAEKFGVEFDLDEYDIVSNPGQEWNGTYVTIFYEKNLGLYPKIHEPTGQDINGGIPQEADIEAHIAKATDDIYRLIPDADYQGLGVIDFKPWRPLWNRNWDSKSEDLVRQTSPYASKAEVTSKAKEEFEGAARMWMGKTLSLVKTLRPGGFWGFYLFPDCYNSPEEIKLRQGTSYDCTKEVKSDNNRLQWLWEGSTGLYPNIYLTSVFKTLPSSEQFVRARVAETFRVMDGRQSSSIPVYPYVRLRYRDSMECLAKADLISSIQEAAGQGSAGVVIWGASADVNSKENCVSLRDYVTSTFGPFAKEMTSQAADCSRRECSSHGRCVTYYEKASNDEPVKTDRSGLVQEGVQKAVQMTSEPPGSAAQQEQQSHEQVISREYASWFGEKLQYLPGRQGTLCRCYPGWTGERCSEQTN